MTFKRVSFQSVAPMFLFFHLSLTVFLSVTHAGLVSPVAPWGVTLILLL
jgi:hypothetical protein